jgi:uncharacterized NAD-dependent epimerase/dehydratase family protein
VKEVIESPIGMGRRTNPDARCAGVSVNTFGLPSDDRAGCLRRLTHETGLPCVDPPIGGCDAIVDYLLKFFARD